MVEVLDERAIPGSRALDDHAHARTLRAVARLDHLQHMRRESARTPATILAARWRTSSLESRPKGAGAERAECDTDDQGAKEQQGSCSTHVHSNASAFTRPLVEGAVDATLTTDTPRTALNVDDARSRTAM